MDKIISILPLTFIPLFVAIDTFWVTALFAPYAKGKPTRTVISIATKSVMTALAVSLAFAWTGLALFSLLGITVNDFKVAGGLLLLIISVVDLLAPGRSLLASAEGGEGGEDAGIFPLGIPLIAGPALLTTLLVLIEHYGAAPTMAALGLNMLVLWLSLISVRFIVKLIPHSLLVALSKIMSLLLAAIAVMLIRLGLQGILQGTPGG